MTARSADKILTLSLRKVEAPVFTTFHLNQWRSQGEANGTTVPLLANFFRLCKYKMRLFGGNGNAVWY